MFTTLRGTAVRAATVTALGAVLIAGVPANADTPESTSTSTVAPSGTSDADARADLLEAQAAEKVAAAKITRAEAREIRAEKRAAKRAHDLAERRAKKRWLAAKKRAEAKKAKEAAALQTYTNRIMGAAASRTGAPYIYGGNGPWGFDCSGYTRWVFNRVGKALPRTSSQQAGATQRISRAALRKGDLVFFHSGGRVYHVGIYAGGNSIYHASRPGTPVGRAPIWTNSIFFGRVR